MQKEINLSRQTIKELVDLALTLADNNTDNCELYLHFSAGIIKITMDFETMEAKV